jgi:hypothetical protein
MKRLFSLLFCLAMCYFLSLPTYRILFFSAHPHILPRLLAALTTTIMNVEDTELFMARSPKCFQNVAGALHIRGRSSMVVGPNFATGRAWISSLSAPCVSSSRCYFRKRTVHTRAYSRQHGARHSIGYPIPTLHSPDPSNWPSLNKGNFALHFSHFFMFSFLLLFFSLSHVFSDFPPLLYFGRGIGIQNKAGLCMYVMLGCVRHR